METNFIEAEKKCFDIKVPELKNIVLRNILHQKKEGICVTAPKKTSKNMVEFDKLDADNSPEIPAQLIQEQNDMLYRPWNRLEKGLKINRLQEYIKRSNNEWKLSTKKIERVLSKLTRKVHKKQLNKKNDVNYDDKKAEIKSIPCLTIKQSESSGKITDIKVTTSLTKKK
jgi:hypothetical protein